MMADDAVADTEEALAEFDFLMPADKASVTRPPANQGMLSVLRYLGVFIIQSRQCQKVLSFCEPDLWINRA